MLNLLAIIDLTRKPRKSVEVSLYAVDVMIRIEYVRQVLVATYKIPVIWKYLTAKDVI